MTTGTIPNPNSFTGNAFYHSPALSSSGSVEHFSSSQFSDGNRTRPTSSSFSSTTSNTGPSYDERFVRRGNLTSPTISQQENIPFSNINNTYRQYQQPPPPPPSNQLQPSSLPGDHHRPVEGGNSQVNYWRY